jgi:uncharacterized iron-regulated protein
MSNFWKRHRALVGYLFLVAVAVVAAQLRQMSVNKRLDRIDQRSCEQRQVLARNQVFTLETLHEIMAGEVHEKAIPLRIRTQLEDRLAHIQDLLAGSNPIRPC